LITFTLNPIFEIPDANGIAVSSVSSSSDETNL
jgi:hypothetical protein